MGNPMETCEGLSVISESAYASVVHENTEKDAPSSIMLTAGVYALRGLSQTQDSRDIQRHEATRVDNGR